MAIPTNGLVFYAPLASNAETAETGQTISWYNSPTFPVINDIPCFYSDSKSYMKIVNVDTLRTAYNSGVFTISFWAQNLKSTSRRSCICFNGSGNYKTEKVLLFGPYKIDQADTSLWGPKDSEEADVDIDHFCYVVNSNNISVYINSELITTVTCETPVISASNALTISGIPQGWNYTSAPTSEKYNGFVSSIRVYNRALSAAEITELSKEFADEGTSGGTGVVINGLFLSTSKPTANQKGLLVNNKFFIPFAESSGGDTSAEYYKCASVDTGGTVIYGKTLVVSGAATSFYNGTYTLQDATATGYNRVWVHSNEEYALSYFASESTEGVSSGFWGFYKISDPSNADYSCKFNTENPWDNPTYISKTYEEEVLSIIHPTSTSAKTWSGYKAVFDSGTGTWSFESDVTEGLAYTSVTPVVGGIYSADALVGVSSLYDKIWNSCNAYYKLDGHCRDSVNIYDGIPNNITFVDGKMGRSAHTNGYSQYISLPKEVSVKGRTQVSYSGWCFIESTVSEDFYIITEIVNSNGYTRAAFGFNTSLLPLAYARTVATGDTGSAQKVAGTSPLSKSTWYFLCAVFDLANGNITLYVNGVAVGSLNVTASSFVNANPYRIRIPEFDGSGSGNVRVDEVGIWSKALSADEVSELYNNGAGKFL